MIQSIKKTRTNIRLCFLDSMWSPDTQLQDCNMCAWCLEIRRSSKDERAELSCRHTAAWTDVESHYPRAALNLAAHMEPITFGDFSIFTALLGTLAIQLGKNCNTCLCVDQLGIANVNTSQRPKRSKSVCGHAWTVCVWSVEIYSQPGFGFLLWGLITVPAGLAGDAWRPDGSPYKSNRLRMGPYKFEARCRFGRLSLSSCRELHFEGKNTHF